MIIFIFFNSELYLTVVIMIPKTKSKGREQGNAPNSQQLSKRLRVIHNKTKPAELIEPVSIHIKGPHKKKNLSDLHRDERPNGIMGVGLESEHSKYGPEFLASFVQWMANHLNHSFFLVGDSELKFNASVFGIRGEQLTNGDLKQAVETVTLAKMEQLNDMIYTLGLEDRMHVFRWSELPSDVWNMRLIRGFFENDNFEQDIIKTLYGNMRARLECHEQAVGDVRFERDLSQIKHYAIEEIAGLLYVFASGLPVGDETVDVHMKVGPRTECWYDKIVSRIQHGGEQYRYRDSDQLVDASAKFNIERGKKPLSWVYFEFPKSDSLENFSSSGNAGDCSNSEINSGSAASG
jgi:hypothetical protein